MSLYERPCHGGPCTLKGVQTPGFCKCKEDAEQIKRMEKALHRCNEAATEAGNDERHTPGERTVARGIGAIIRQEIAALAKPEKGREG